MSCPAGTVPTMPTERCSRMFKAHFQKAIAAYMQNKFPDGSTCSTKKACERDQLVEIPKD